MASDGLSLVGFLDEQMGVTHLRRDCIPPDPTEGALRTAWQQAKERLGTPIPQPGNPRIEPIPDVHAPYMLNLTQLPWVTTALNGDLSGASFKLVEIDPLLAFQFTVDSHRKAHHCNGIATPPTLEQLLPICLPLAITPEPLQISALGQSIMVRSRSANFRVIRQGALQNQEGQLQGAGVLVGMSLPFVHVVRLNGRCYLHNGYHRATGLRAMGATQMPCIFRDVKTADEVGIKSDGTTFGEAQLTSMDPPTVGHFSSERAYPVKLRAHARIIHVAWAEYFAYEE